MPSIFIGKQNIQYIIGIDEVGRGPVAGPVAVGVVKIPIDFDMSVFEGVKDSKKLSQKKREEWLVVLNEYKKKGLLDCVVCCVDASVIDEKGIVFSVHTALFVALTNLNVDPSQCSVLLDGGLKAPECFLFQKTIIKGDEKEIPIALASIVAKVTRDKKMVRFAKQYPLYGFEKHKGYGTCLHYECIKKHGTCALHRKTFLKNI